MDRRYILELFDSFGTRLAYLDQRYGWSVTRTANDIGGGTFAFPLNAGFASLLKHDMIIKIGQSLQGSAVTPIDDTFWIIDKVRVDGANYEIQVDVVTPVAILQRRLITALETTAQADKTGQLDTIMKAYVAEQFAGSRGVQGFTVAAAVVNSAIPSLAADNPHKGSYEYVFDALTALVNDAGQQNVLLYFDVVQTDSLFNIQFRTYLNQRGTIRPDIRIGSRFGNATGYVIESDRSEEVNSAYALGDGDGQRRIVGTAINTARATATRFSLREGVTDANESTKQVNADQAAKRMLFDQRLRLRYEGKLIETPQLRYGPDIQFGDQVFVTEQGITFACRLDSVTMGEGGSGPILDIALRGDNDVNLFF